MQNRDDFDGAIREEQAYIRKGDPKGDGEARLAELRTKKHEAFELASARAEQAAASLLAEAERAPPKASKSSRKKAARRAREADAVLQRPREGAQGGRRLG